MLAQITDLRRVLAARRLPAGELRELQAGALRAAVEHACERTPYYRQRFQRAGVEPGAIRVPADLARLPITSKADLVAAGADALARDAAPAGSRRTSGSTGRSLRIPVTAAEEREHNLIIFRTLLAMGMRPRDRLAVASAMGAHHTRPYQRLGLFRSTNVSRFLTPGEQLLALQRYQPTLLWGYPTVLRRLLPLVDDQLSRVIRPRALINAGEVLDPHLRARLLDDLEAEPFQIYGATEVGIIAGECRSHRGLHVNADRLVLECVGPDGPVPAGTRGEAVVTCFGERAMPMIRYRVGDVIRILDEPCPCGSAFPLIEPPVGRHDDALRLLDGRRLYPGECDAFSGCREVLQYRFAQESAERVRVQVQLRRDPTDAVRADLRRRVAAFLGHGLEGEIEIVERFDETEIKFRTFRPRWTP